MAARTGTRRALAAACALAAAAGARELVVLFGAGALAAGAALRPGRPRSVVCAVAVAPRGGGGRRRVRGDLAVAVLGVPEDRLSMLGSGYVLLFLRADLVERLGWMTESQLIDAIAVGEGDARSGVHHRHLHRLDARPARRHGAGDAGDLPAGVRVRRALGPAGAAHPRVARHQGRLLDSVNAASLALMAVVTARIAHEALVNALTVALAGGAGASARWCAAWFG